MRTLTGQKSRLPARFGLLGLLALMVTLPYALPAFWDLVLLAAGGERGIYLEKPTTNHTYYLQIGMCAILLPYLLWRVFVPERPFLHNSLIWIVGALFAYQLIRAFYTDHPGYSFRAFLLPAMFFCAFMLVQSLQPRVADFEKIMVLLLAAVIPLCVYALVQSQGYDFLNYSKTAIDTSEEITGKQMIASTFGHPNYMASYVAPLVYWALYFILAGRGLTKGIGLTAFPAIVAALIVGGTRGAWLAVLAAAVPYYILLTLHPTYRRRLLFAAGVAVVLVVIMLFLPIPFLKVQFNVSERLFASKEISNRFYYWLMALEMFKQQPWFGVGIGNFNVLFWDTVSTYQQTPDSRFFRFILEENTRGVFPGFVHNDHLQMLAESGLLGAGLWLALWSAFLAQGWEVARRSSRRPKDVLLAATFLAVCVCVGVDGLTNFPLQIPVSGLLFWVMLGCWSMFTGIVYDRHRPPPAPAHSHLIPDVPRIRAG